MQLRHAAMTSLFALAACGGGGADTLSSGSVPPPVPGATPTPTPTPTPDPITQPTPTPTPSPTPTPGQPTPTPTPTPTPGPTTGVNMFDVTAATSFNAVGGLHSLSIDENGASLYQGNASTVAAPSGSISYNPRDGIFVLSLADAAAGVSRDITFQDPGHRSTADSARSGEYQVPLLTGFNYLQALDGDALLTFFYKRPGANSAFVSLGGFERSTYDRQTGAFNSEQGVFAFGSPTSSLQVPVRGTGRFEGDFLATMVGQAGTSSPVLQWINGTSGIDVDFGARTMNLSLTGVVGPGFVKNMEIPDAAFAIGSGSVFNAQGSASWTAASTSFAGKFTSAGFTMGSTAIPIDFSPVSAGTSVAGASSIDGTFYGPNGENIGGNVRIVGGVPDQRVDILGAFIGAKK